MQVPSLLVIDMVVAMLSFVGGSWEDNSETIPDCGVASAYCFLKLSGRSPELRGLEAALTNLRPDVDLSALSIADLREVITNYGVAVTSVQVDPRSIEELPVPAILYLDPRPGRTKGHFVVVRAVGESVVDLIDLSSIPGNRVVATKDVAAVWSGKAILAGKSNWSSIQGWTEWLAPASTIILSVVLLRLVCQGWKGAECFSRSN